MKNKNSIKKNDQGLTIIELVIVLAIMAILGAAMFLSTAVATDKHVSSCANKICISMEQIRNLTLGKQSGSITFRQTANGELYVQQKVNGSNYGDEVMIGHQGLKVTLEYTDGSSTDLSGSNIVLEYSRSTGAITRFLINGTSSTKKLSKIIITNGRKTVTVSVDMYTGRVSVS